MSGLSPSGLTVPSSGSATGNPRNKTALKPGRSLMDWVRLGHSGVDLSGRGGGSLQDVTQQELAKHSTRRDAWMALKGKVYNVTPYMEFHPGGEEELMRGVGRDATHLFNEVHKWVNFEGMLQKCLVGRLVESKPFFFKPSFLPLGRSSDKIASNSTEEKKKSLSVPNTNTQARDSSGKSPAASPLTPSPLPTPKYDWFQTHTTINVAVYTRWKHMSRERVVVMKRKEVLRVLCYVQDMVYTVHLQLDKAVRPGVEVRVSGSAGRVDVMLQKEEENVRWAKAGKMMPGHGEHCKSVDKEPEFVECRLLQRESVTHNTYLLVLQVPDDTHLPIPPGHHVYLRSPNKEVVKPYTPVASSFSLDIQEEPGTLIYLFIKVYSDGSLTPILETLPLSSTLEVSLPEGNFSHQQLAAATTTASQLLLLGAGTGLTPMVRLMLIALKNNKNVHLVLFNKTENDIPWRDELERLAEESSGLLKVTHVLSEGGTTWSGLRGRLDKAMLLSLLPDTGQPYSTFVCVCGPTQFTKLSVSLLDELEYSRDAYHAFLG